jgi:hypothetical protein
MQEDQSATEGCHEDYSSVRSIRKDYMVNKRRGLVQAAWVAFFDRILVSRFTTLNSSVVLLFLLPMQLADSDFKGSHRHTHSIRFAIAVIPDRRLTLETGSGGSFRFQTPPTRPKHDLQARRARHLSVPYNTLCSAGGRPEQACDVFMHKPECKCISCSNADFRSSVFMNDRRRDMRRT